MPTPEESKKSWLETDEQAVVDILMEAGHRGRVSPETATEFQAALADLMEGLWDRIANEEVDPVLPLDEWITDEQNARVFVADLTPWMSGDGLTVSEAVLRVRSTLWANPKVLRVKLLEFTDDGRGARLAVWRGEDYTRHSGKTRREIWDEILDSEDALLVAAPKAPTVSEMVEQFKADLDTLTQEAWEKIAEVAVSLDVAAEEEPTPPMAAAGEKVFPTEGNHFKIGDRYVDSWQWNPDQLNRTYFHEDGAVRWEDARTWAVRVEVVLGRPLGSVSAEELAGSISSLASEIREVGVKDEGTLLSCDVAIETQLLSTAVSWTVGVVVTALAHEECPAVILSCSAMPYQEKPDD